MIVLYVDGTPLAAQQVTDEVVFDSGQLALQDNTHEFAVRAEDVAGNSSALSAALQVTIDSTAPAEASLGVEPAAAFQPDRDDLTQWPVATLVGHTEPSARADSAGSDRCRRDR